MPQPSTAPSIRIGDPRPAAGRVRERGFTLLEMIIVFTLIGILVGLALPEYKYSLRKARETVLKTDLYEMRKLIGQYYNDKHKYPPALPGLVVKYLRQSGGDDESADTGSRSASSRIRGASSGVELGVVGVNRVDGEAGWDSL
jgi:prepilin-type N-terminal cleavage/methylation domain-containing protein